MNYNFFFLRNVYSLKSSRCINMCELDFDAILFHIRQPDIQTGKLVLPVFNRKPSQNYIMFINESPIHDQFHYEKFINYFNWTMTYRKDSDFYQPYGWVAPKNWTWHYPSDTAKENWSQYFISPALGFYIY